MAHRKSNATNGLDVVEHDAIATRTKTRCSSGHDVQEDLLTLIQRQSARCFGNGKQSYCCLKPRFFNTLKRLWSRQVFPVRTSGLLSSA